MSITRHPGTRVLTRPLSANDVDVRERSYGEVQSEVFKDFLPHVASRYCVRDVASELDPTECVASFDVTKLVLEADGRALEKLKNVYHLLADSTSTIAVVLHRTSTSARLSMAVGIDRNDSEAVRNLATSVRDAMLGNFPGSEIGPVEFSSASDSGAFAPLDQRTQFQAGGFSSIGVVTNIASDFGDDFSLQGIERLIDGVRVAPDEEYTLILMGTSVPAEEIALTRERLHRLYTLLSPFEKVQRSWGESESKTWSSGVTGGLGANGGPEGAFAGFPILPSIGGYVGKASTRGTTSGETVTITEYGVSHTLRRIEDHMERLELSEALGRWSFAAYVVAPEIRLVSEVAHTYMSLTQGQSSAAERPAINIWNAQAAGGARRPEIEMMRRSLVRLRHPEFEKLDVLDGGVFNELNWPRTVTCTAELSGAELTKAVNIPRRSIPGVPVIECAPFGREVSSYDTSVERDVVIGRIHHMHADEALPVALSSESLASHVFVTGSTGAGKSNAVCQLLSEAGVGFLVIEPAKGEYRHEIGADARVLGTNPIQDDILQINPFAFPEGIHVYEHIDRILEVFNVAWPMYAAMPAVLKAAVVRAYEEVGWNLKLSVNEVGRIFPTVADVLAQIDLYIQSSDYSTDTQGDYRGALKTRLESLTTGLNGLLFCGGDLEEAELFDSRVIVDLSRVGSTEVKALVMGVLVIRLQEYRMCNATRANERLRHLTILEEAHTILRGSQSVGSGDGAGTALAGKGVEMLANAIAEMRTYGEGFVIADQSPGLLDRSVIRNTNTKIILRLPDEGDRLLVGRAAGLKDVQIAELSRLQRGVAAVYQNEWIEPVLCHIDRFRARPRVASSGQIEAALNRHGDQYEDARRTVGEYLFDPYRFAACSPAVVARSVRHLDLAPSLEARILMLLRVGPTDAFDAWQSTAFEFFAMDEFITEAPEHSPAEIADLLDHHLAKHGVDRRGDTMGQRDAHERFIKSMVDWHINGQQPRSALEREREFDRLHLLLAPVPR